MNKFTYFFYRKYKQIRNVIRWIPVVWNNFDFDYRYALDAFKFQLGNIADHMESDRAATMSAGIKAQRIRTIIKLMDKVYDEEYAMEYLDEIERLYGKEEIKFVETEIDGEKYFEMLTVFEKDYTDEQLEKIEKHKTKLLTESQEKQKKAHRLLWELIEHDIRGFWD